MAKFQSDRNNIFEIRRFIREYLDILGDKENESEAVQSIIQGIEFKGATLWILIFAIFVASLGLNTNSTAVIIGAMLISPLMGPIMGVGLAIGINDFDLMKRSLKSYLVATLFSVATATLFFLVSPVVEGQSELLARTSPTIYDVFIALIGGLAGFVALVTPRKGSVIPGVAIATALMPPLCTAGFGLATGNLVYFLGAFYLYFINSVFICLATYIGTRVFHFKRKEFSDVERQKKVKRYIVWVVILTMVPSVYLTYRIFTEAFYETNVSRFVQEQLSFENAQVVSRHIDTDGKKKTLRVVLVGQEVPDSVISLARVQMPYYKLDDTDLMVLQGVSASGASGEVSLQLIEQLYSSINEVKNGDEQRIDSLSQVLEGYTRYESMSVDMAPEIKVLYPQISDIAIYPAVEVRIDSVKTQKKVFSVVKTDGRKLSQQQMGQLEQWLKARVKTDDLELVIK